MWAALIKEYWQVSLFKRTPADTPYSPLLLVLIVSVFFILLCLQWQFVKTETPLSVSFTVLAGISLIVSYIVYSYLLLLIFGLKNRLLQTLTSLFAGHTIVHLLALPMLLLVPLLGPATIPQPLALLIGIVYLLLTLILTVWQFMITVFIYKQALEVESISAVLASIGLLAVNILVVSFWR